MPYRIVIDASAIIAVISNEASKDHIIQRTQGAELIAPASIHWEIGNAFSAMLKRGRVTLEEAIQSLAVYKQIPIRLVDVELDASIRLAAELNIYAYDAFLIRCAWRYQAPLLSLDGGLNNSARLARVEVVEVPT